MASMTAEEEQRFRDRYRTSSTDPLVQAETEVLGSDYRANGYTTKARADEVAYAAVGSHGEALPFRSEAFDAVVHTDLTC